MTQLLITVIFDPAQVLIVLVVFALFLEKSGVYYGNRSFKSFALALATKTSTLVLLLVTEVLL